MWTLLRIETQDCCGTTFSAQVHLVTIFGNVTFVLVFLLDESNMNFLGQTKYTKFWVNYCQILS
jgi:hypothetical protein